MFPHMYKVRPGKSQQVKSPTMSADCDKWQASQAESWRRNSQKWGSQGWEGGPPSPASSIPQTPPPIPAPPQDPQDNLTKEASGSSNSTVKEDTCNNNATGESAPPWRRSRSRTNSPPKIELEAPPTTGRRRSRNVMRDLNCPTGDTSRNSTSPPVRRRSRHTTDESENISDRSSSIPERRRRRPDENETNADNPQEMNRSTSPPVRRRTREASSENDFKNENVSNEETSHPIRRRSKSRALQTDENTSSNNLDSSSEGNRSAIRRRSRSRAQQVDENADTVDSVTDNAKFIVTRRRSRPTNQQESQENEVQLQDSSSPSPRVRVRNPSADTNSASDNVEEVVVSLPPRRRRPPVVVEDKRKGHEEEQKQLIGPKMAVETTLKEKAHERSPEPELCRSTLQIELKTPISNAQKCDQVPSCDISNNDSFKVEDSNEESTATVVIQGRPTSMNATTEDETNINFEVKETGDRRRKRSDRCTEIQNQELNFTEETDENPTSTVNVQRRTPDNQIRNASEERINSANTVSRRVSKDSGNEDGKPQSYEDEEEKQTATVRIHRRSSMENTDDLEVSPNILIATDTNFAAENEEPSQNDCLEKGPTETNLVNLRFVTSSTGDLNQEAKESETNGNYKSHFDEISLEDGRDNNSTESPVVNQCESPENEIIISDGVVDYVHDNDKPKDEEDEWTNVQQNNEDNNMDADGWANCDVEAETEAFVVHNRNDEEKDATVGEDEEDDVAKATRIWLESQQALLAPPKPMKIIYLTEEELMFDPLQQAQEEEKVHFNTDYDSWDAEPADQEPTPEFLKKKLKKVEAQSNLAPLKIDRERSSISPVFGRRRRGSSPSHDQIDENELRSSARSRRSRATEDSNHEDKVQETAPISEVPPPPPPPPPPPASKTSIVPPPPPAPPLSKKDKELKKAREEMVEQIKKAARTRPDWHSVMKDIEGGIKLRKVGKDMKADRSMPILPSSRGKGGKFVYESEKPMMHNEMLEAIQRGVRLRHVRTNDRSRPDFNKLGIRKLRRQVTTEEKKPVDPDTPEALPSSSDEEEDIDQMRDDLQSTKTQLSEEIKKTKQIERENKILKIDIESLQAEVKRMKRRLKESGIHEAKLLANGEADAIAPKLSKSMSKLRMREEDLDFSELDNIEEDIKILNEQIEAQKKRAEQAEQKCEELTQKMEVADNSTNEWEMRSIYFEKKFKALQKDQGIELPDINCIGTQTEIVDISAPDSPNALPTKKSLSRKSFGKLNRMESFKEEEEDTDESSSEEEESLSDHIDGDEDDGHNDIESEGEEDDDVRAERQAENESIKREREFKLCQNKLGHSKEKMKNVKRERNNLRDRIKKYYKDMRKEREEYLKVKAELRELAEQMKDEESLVDDSYEETDDSAEDSLSENEGTHKKPKKLKKRRRRKIISEDKQEEILHNDEPDDLCDLDDPEWSASEDSDSDQDNEDDDIKTRIKKLKDKVEIQEQLLNERKKENLMLKSQIDRCDEQYGEERRRNARINTELQLLFADI